jgi:hypothetical protein
MLFIGMAMIVFVGNSLEQLLQKGMDALTLEDQQQPGFVYHGLRACARSLILPREELLEKISDQLLEKRFLMLQGIP